MAVNSRAVTVAATATQLNGADVSERWQTTNGVATSLAVQVPTGGSAIYLGGSGVTSAAGYSVGAGESFSVDLSPGEDLYAITASGTQAVRVFQSGV